MSTAYELMERLRTDGASRFAATGLAANHSPLTRKVRRQRAVRTAGVSVASVAAAGAVVFAGSQFLDSNQGVPPATNAPTNPAPTAPAPSASAAVDPLGTVTVTPGERVEYVAASLAELFGVSQEEALAAIVAALPPEAQGSPEGWVAVGEHGFDTEVSLADAAAAMVKTQVQALESSGVPRDQWHDTVVLASIVEKEAPVLTDKPSVARVLVNRLDAGMLLQVESPLAYYLRADEQPVGDDGWAVDTPFNTFMYEGLPPTAIGTPSGEAIAAAVTPATGDWLYFLRKPDGNILLFTAFEDYAVAVDEMYPGTGASG